jgi:hypothetical protein
LLLLDAELHAGEDTVHNAGAVYAAAQQALFSSPALSVTSLFELFERMHKALNVGKINN